MMEETQPLAGKRVLVTRAAAQAEALAGPLRALGAKVELVPALEIQRCEDGGLKQAISRLRHYDALVVTSVNGAQAVIAEARRQGIALEKLRQLDVMAVGPQTAETLFGGGATQTRFAAHNWTSAGMADHLRKDVEGKRVLLVQGTEASNELAEDMFAAGGLVERVDAYRSVVPPVLGKQVGFLVRSGIAPDAVTFTSGQIALNFFRALSARKVNLPDSTVIASIGPVTTAALKELGYPPAVEAPEQRMTALASALGEFFRGKG